MPTASAPDPTRLVRQLQRPPGRRSGRLQAPHRRQAPSRRPGGHLALASLSLAAGLMAAPAQAATSSQNLTFSTGTQSLWGGANPAAFGGSGYIVGNRNLGVSYDIGASSGTVSSTVRGGLRANHDAAVGWDQRGAVFIGFDFVGGSSSFNTRLGAWANVSGHLDVLGVNWTPALIDQNYALNIDRSFSANFLVPRTGTDAFTPATVGLNAPSWFPASGGVGVDLDINQTAGLTIIGLSGTVQATHRDSGAVVSQALALLGPVGSPLSFDLGQAGIWDFSYQSVTLSSSFSSAVSLSATAYAEYAIGFDCGDRGTDSDNGFLCAGDGRSDGQLTSLRLFDTPTLALGYGPLNTGTAFSVEVMAAPVPEPATWALVLAGLGVLLRRARSSQAWRAR